MTNRFNHRGHGEKKIAEPKPIVTDVLTSAKYNADVRCFATATFVLAVSMFFLGQSADAPSVEEVVRQVPPDPHQLDFLRTGLNRPIPAMQGFEIGEKVFFRANKVGAGMTAPRLVKSPDPEYPRKSYPLEGTVVLWVIIGPDGKPHDIRVQRTLGSEFDKAAHRRRAQVAVQACPQGRGTCLGTNQY